MITLTICRFEQVERLARDPLRYVKDPSRLESDLATREEEHQHESTEPAFPVNKSEKRSRTGFNKRLLKNDIGKEQSFEEARANSKFYTIAPPSINFNLLRVDEADQSSQMDLDEEASIDVSMDESVPQFDQEPRLKVQRLGSKTGGKVLFRTEASFDRSTSLNKTAISTASSTVQELNAVGVPTKKEEETINTKFAMRELSMMFSSPAYGVDDVARKTEQSSRVNQSTDGSQHCGVDVSYCNVGDILGTSMLDNSILNIDGADSENRGPRNPFARSTATPGFEKMALRELESESDADESLLQCSTGRQRPLKQALQEDPLRGSEVELTDDPGFRIYQDDTDENPVADRGQPSGGVGFSIFEDADDKEQGDEKAEPSGGLGFTLFEDGDGIKQDDEKKAPTGGQGFTIFEDGVAEGAEETSSSEDLAKGDTASFSLFGDAVAILDDERSNRSKSQAALGRASTNSGGETATLSLFNEAFNEINEASASSPKRTGGFEIFVDNDEEGDHVS